MLMESIDIRKLAKEKLTTRGKTERRAFLDANLARCSICLEESMEVEEKELYEKDGITERANQWFAYRFRSNQQGGEMSDGKNWRLVCDDCNEDRKEIDEGIVGGHTHANPRVNRFLVKSICENLKKTRDKVEDDHGRNSNEYKKWEKLLEGIDGDDDEKRNGKRRTLVGLFVKQAIEEKLQRTVGLGERMVPRILQLSVNEGDWDELIGGVLDSNLGDAYIALKEINRHLEDVRVASEAIKELEVSLKGPNKVAKEIMITAVEKLRQQPDHLGSEFVIFEERESGKVLIDWLKPGDSETVREVPFEQTEPFDTRE